MIFKKLNKLSANLTQASTDIYLFYRDLYFSKNFKLSA